MILLSFNRLQLALLSVYMIVAIDMFGMTLVIPVMTLFAQYLGATKSSIGLLYALYSGGAFASSLFLGRISDVVGRRKVFLWTLTGAVIGIYLRFNNNLPSWPC